MALPYKITTIGSHSALQILKGAKDEGFGTIVVCVKGTEEPYKSFKVADKIITINSYGEFESVQKRLLDEKAILIPHASFIAYMGFDRVEKLKVPYFGNKKILRFEADRNLQREWLKDSGINIPKIFKNPADIDRSVIVKFHGAKGGAGYFIAKDPKDFRQKIRDYPKDQKYVIQEYIVGVPVYAHYFYSPITDELEILSFDKRYESNVDSIGRISARDQLALAKVDPSYVIIGNMPLVVRESLLPELFRIGRNVVEESKKFASPGLFGPFSLEMIIRPDMQIFVFEISARIVAGTNPYIYGSPYSWLRYNVPMSTGRRIAREIKLAIKKRQLNKILHNDDKG